MRTLFLLLTSVCVLSGCATAGKAIDRDRDSRKFDIEYVVEIADAPVGEKIEIWIPRPGNDDHQLLSDFGYIEDSGLKDVTITMCYILQKKFFLPPPSFHFCHTA